MPIATLMGLSIIYIIVQSTVNSNMLTNSITDTIAAQLSGQSWMVLLPTSTIYDLVNSWSLPQSTSFIAGLSSSSATSNEVFLSNLSSPSSLGADLAWRGQTNSDLIKAFSATPVGAISGYNTSQVYNLAEWLYGGATIGLIIASIVLLLAMIAPIVLCKVGEPTSTRSNN